MKKTIKNYYLSAGVLVGTWMLSSPVLAVGGSRPDAGSADEGLLGWMVNVVKFLRGIMDLLLIAAPYLGAIFIIVAFLQIKSKRDKGRADQQEPITNQIWMIAVGVILIVVGASISRTTTTLTGDTEAANAVFESNEEFEID